MATILFIFFVVFLIVQMPVSFCLVISTVLAMFIASDIDSIAIILKALPLLRKLPSDRYPVFYSGGGIHGGRAVYRGAWSLFHPL